MAWSGKEPLTGWPELDYAAMREEDGYELIFDERPRVSSELLAELAVEQRDGMKAPRKRRARIEDDDGTSIESYRNRERLSLSRQSGGHRR